MRLLRLWQERRAKLAAARAEIEARARARAAAEMVVYEAQLAERQAQEASGAKLRGSAPQAPSAEPKPTDQNNFTDAESRIMKAGNGPHFEQSYNAQAAVEVESRMIVGPRVSQAPNGKQELVPTVAAVLIDSGFYSAAAVQAVEQTEPGQPGGTSVYAAMEKKAHHRTVSDLEQKSEPSALAPGASISEVMHYRLKLISVGLTAILGTLTNANWRRSGDQHSDGDGPTACHCQSTPKRHPKSSP